MKKQKVQAKINLEALAGGAFAEKLNEALNGRRSGSGTRGNTSCSSYTGTESDRQASGS